MNIQPSVMIWTALCFLLTVLILHNWLFRPVLTLLDRRRAALDAARAKKDEYARLKLRQEEALEAKRAEYRRKQKEKLQAEAVRLEERSKSEIKEAQRDCLRNIEACREALQEDYGRIIAAAGARMKDAAKIIAEKITSYGPDDS